MVAYIDERQYNVLSVLLSVPLVSAGDRVTETPPYPPLQVDHTPESLTADGMIQLFYFPTMSLQSAILQCTHLEHLNE
jgi:hypothetical protein